MLLQLSRLLQRYVKANLVLGGDTAVLRDAGGTRIGQLTEVRWERGRLVLHGRCRPGEVALELAGMRAATHVAGEGAPFSLALPWPPDLALESGRALLHAADARPCAVRLRGVTRARLLLVLRFFWTILRLAPEILRWQRHRDIAARARIKAALRLDPALNEGPLEAGLFDAPPAPPPGPDPRATIVVPVYNAFELLQDCLSRLARNSGGDWRLVLIEDGSTDPRIRPWLRDWVAAQPQDRATLIEAPENRGFVASVNAALATVLVRPAAETGPVVLLNSDAMVPEGWLPRLLEPLGAADVASVTPMSNDAEIFSVPAICARLDLAGGQAEAIDALASRLAPAATLRDAPTGVGFCMALDRRFLERLPGLDPVFGRGYGEEVDWCRKAAALGGRHLGTARLFVEHRGGASFGTEEKRALIARNNARISARYPGYDGMVQDFILTDPLRSARLALGLAWAGSAGQQVPIYLAHALGGGAENWLAARIAEDAAEGLASVVLRVGGAARWQLELHGPSGAVAGWSGDFALIARFLEPLPARRVVYSCGVGDSDPFTLPECLLSLCRKPQDRLEILFHDYMPVSPSFTLLDGDGRYRGLPRDSDPAHRTRRPGGETVTLQAWQAEWGRLVARADLLRVFCPSSAGIVAATWPGCDDRLTVTPHRIRTRIAPLPVPPAGTPPRLAVLGNIAPHKGAALVGRLARMPLAQRGFDMVLLGNIDPAFPLPRGFPVHGDYDPADIPSLARHYGITHWLIPSVWPETFSFTTHEALATGLPVLAFGIGAQGDTVAAAPNGRILPHDPEADLAETVLRAMRQEAP